MTTPNWPDMPEPAPVIFLSWENIYNTLEKLGITPTRELVIDLFKSNKDDLAYSGTLANRVQGCP